MQEYTGNGSWSAKKDRKWSNGKENLSQITETDYTSSGFTVPQYYTHMSTFSFIIY